jgi:hypothetical protein
MNKNNQAIIDGTIEYIFPEKHVSDGFNIREFVVNTGGQYPQTIICQLTNSRCDLIIGKHIGDKVLAHVNIRGRKAKGETKYYNQIDCWKLEKI